MKVFFFKKIRASCFVNVFFKKLSYGIQIQDSSLQNGNILLLHPKATSTCFLGSEEVCFGLMNTKILLAKLMIQLSIFLQLMSRSPAVLHRILELIRKQFGLKEGVSHCLQNNNLQQPSKLHAVEDSVLPYKEQAGYFIIILCHWIVYILLSRQNKMKVKVSLVWTR